MEAANERALRTRGRLAYSRATLARRRAESGGSACAEGVDAGLPVARLRPLLEDYARWRKLEGHSPRTIADRAACLGWFLWFIERENFQVAGRAEIEAYLFHLREGHLEPHGRFGKGTTNANAFKALRPASYRHHFKILKAWFSWQTEKRALWQKSPFTGLDRGKNDDDEDVKIPLTPADVELLLASAKRGQSPHRDVAIIRFLYDTGVRASELCGITFEDIDENAQSVKIFGKGRKWRLVYYGNKTARALWKHMNDIGLIWGEEARAQTAPLFASERGTRAGQNLQPRALHLMITKTGVRAGVANVYPHRFRHTFAINFLKNGGNQMSLMRALGHTDLTMTKHYVNFADADLEEQWRKFGPGDRLKG